MFASVAPRLVDNGYLPIPLNGKRPAINGWNKLKHTEEGLEKLSRQFPKANVGVRTGNLVAIDIDLEEHSAAGRVAALTAEILGFTDFIRVGRWPRRALLYRRSRPTDKQTVGKVEVLGKGQQVP